MIGLMKATLMRMRLAGCVVGEKHHLILLDLWQDMEDRVWNV